jgi:hypothetical protein
VKLSHDTNSWTAAMLYQVLDLEGYGLVDTVKVKIDRVREDRMTMT